MGKKKGGKDSVTGLSINIDGLGKIQSDKIYGKDSAIGQYLTSFSGGASNLEDWKAEYEFGKRYFVQTITFKSNSPDLVAQNVNRTVFEGAFSYKNNKIVSARIDSVAQFSDSFTQGGYADIVRFEGGKTISKPSSLASWNEVTFNLSSGTNIASYDFWQDSSTGQIRASGDAGPFASFGEGRFFYDGWQNNPFASNLI